MLQSTRYGSREVEEQFLVLQSLSKEKRTFEVAKTCESAADASTRAILDPQAAARGVFYCLSRLKPPSK